MMYVRNENYLSFCWCLFDQFLPIVIIESMRLSIRCVYFVPTIAWCGVSVTSKIMAQGDSALPQVSLVILSFAKNPPTDADKARKNMW